MSFTYDSPLPTRLYIYPTYCVTKIVYPKKSNTIGYLQINSLRNLSKPRQSGVMSKASAKRLKNSCDWLLLSAKKKWLFSKSLKKWINYRCTFVTLTIPDVEHDLSDREILKQLLHPFLSYCYKYFGMRNYVWKAETQKNGQIHFHLITDCFIWHVDLKTAWNRLLKKEGILRKWHLKGNDGEPNSTDIHKIKSVKDLSAYVATYMSKKEEGRRKVNCRVWGCSYSLSKNRVVIEEDILQASNSLQSDLFDQRVFFKSIRSERNQFGEDYEIAQYFGWKLTDVGKIIKNRVFELIRENVAKIREDSNWTYALKWSES